MNVIFISYRKLILNSILLCAAADAGDMPEVTRLLSTTPTSPNVLGLRHKNALHLSSAKGYPEIVELLIMNGVSTITKYLNYWQGINIDDWWFCEDIANIKSAICFNLSILYDTYM